MQVLKISDVVNINDHKICIEKDEKYFKISCLKYIFTVFSKAN